MVKKHQTSRTGGRGSCAFLKLDDADVMIVEVREDDLFHFGAFFICFWCPKIIFGSLISTCTHIRTLGALSMLRTCTLMRGDTVLSFLLTTREANHSHEILSV